jgi:hypothetical protein
MLDRWLKHLPNDLFIIVIISVFYAEAISKMVEITKKAHTIDGLPSLFQVERLFLIYL